MRYIKTHLALPAQVRQLVNRGLAIAAPQAAEQFLSRINYYRLSAYFRPFQSAPDVFIKGTTFEQVTTLYEFDCDLRSLVSEALEPIEISLRTAIAYRMGQRFGPFAHTDPSNFWEKFRHVRWPNWLVDVHRSTDRANETFVEHFKKTYEEYPDLPIWTAVEIMSFGTLSRMFSGLRMADKEAISKPYRLDALTFGSWLHTLVYIRNICAHHARLWNRVMSIAPRLPPIMQEPHWHPPHLTHPQNLGTILFVLNTMLTRVPPVRFQSATWRDKIEALLQMNPGLPAFYSAMGIPSTWPRHPLW